jgi:MinD-like ATPase involved in chromosome partitioning or flagellar assembly
MAMANVAWLLALQGHRVLAIDWDLEAPGLHRYLHPFLEDPELHSTDGILDFAIELASEAANVEDITAMPDEFFHEKGNILRFVEPLDCSRFGENVRFDFIAAGRQGPAYSKRLSLFNWHQFYTRLGGERFLNAARDWLKSEYDYILIDSRTGVSDTSGICTVQMPSTLVICFTLNDQSIQGASAIAQSVRMQREADERDGTFRILPIPTRVEMFSEHERRQIALDYARPFFDVYLKRLTRPEKNAYWAQVQMAYFPYYAFEEIPALFGSNPAEDISLVTSVKRIVGYITGSDPHYPELREDLRREVLDDYQRKRTPASLAARAQTIFESLQSEQQATVREAMLRLVTVGTDGSSDSAQSSTGLTQRQREALAEFEDSGIVAERRQGPTHIWSFAAPELVAKWTTLQSWIEQDRPFLLWRQRLAAASESWSISERDEDALLRGRQLDEALAWLETRGSDLLPTEVEYIQLSRKATEIRATENVPSFPSAVPAAVTSAVAEPPAPKRRSWLIPAGVAALLAIVAAGIVSKLPGDARQNDVLVLAKGALVSNNRELAALLIAESVQRQPARLEEAANMLQQLAPLRLASWRATGTGTDVTFVDASTLIASSNAQVVRYSLADRSTHVYDGAVGPAAVSGPNGYIAFARPANSFVVAKLDGAKVFSKTTASKVNTVAISPDAKYVAGGTHNGTVYVQNLPGGSDARAPISGKEVMQTQFSPDSRYLAVAERSNTARIGRTTLRRSSSP